MAEKRRQPASTPDVYIALEFQSPELKQEAIDVFCKEQGYVNQKAEGTLPEETTKEDFFKACVGDIIIQRITNARVKNEKAALSIQAVEARKHVGDKVKQELKDVKIK